MNVGELRHNMAEQWVWLEADQEVLVEVRLADGSVLPCWVSGVQNSMAAGPFAGGINLVLVATPLE